jgi:hypothetical protein
MKFSELCKIQKDWEQERNLEELNTLAYGLFRMQEELDEAKEAVGLYELFTEVGDVVIFAHSLLFKLCDQLEVP